MPLQMAGGSICQPFNWRPVAHLNVPPTVLPMAMPRTGLVRGALLLLENISWGRRSQISLRLPCLLHAGMEAKIWSFLLDLGWEVKRKGDLEEGINSLRRRGGSLVSWGSVEGGKEQGEWGQS